MASTREREDHARAVDDEGRVGADLARALDESARALIERGEEGVERTLELIVRGAIASIPHVEQAGVSLVERGGGVESYAPSSDAVREIDEIQSELGEGPCLDAIWSEQRTVIDDMDEAHERWPRYAAAARERGMGSLMALQLFATKGSAGALNLYAPTARVFDEGTADTGALFAAQAALVLHGAQRVHNLHIALDSRDVIGQAKGILIERFGASPEKAFAMLVQSSQNTNMKLVDVASWLVGEARKKPDRTAGR